MLKDASLLFMRLYFISIDVLLSLSESSRATDTLTYLLFLFLQCWRVFNLMNEPVRDDPSTFTGKYAY